MEKEKIKSYITGDQEQFIRLSCLVSALVTQLKEKGLITNEDMEIIFEAAEHICQMEMKGMFSRVLDEMEKMK